MALAQVSEKEGDGGPQTGKHEGVLETEAEGRGHAGGQADLTRGGPCCFRRSRKKQGAVSTAVSRGRRSVTFRRTVGVGNLRKVSCSVHAKAHGDLCIELPNEAKGTRRRRPWLEDRTVAGTV